MILSVAIVLLLATNVVKIFYTIFSFFLHFVSYFLDHLNAKMKEIWNIKETNIVYLLHCFAKHRIWCKNYSNLHLFGVHFVTNERRKGKK